MVGDLQCFFLFLCCHVHFQDVRRGASEGALVPEVHRCVCVLVCVCRYPPEPLPLLNLRLSFSDESFQNKVKFSKVSLQR